MNTDSIKDTAQISLKEKFLTNEPKLEKRRFLIMIMFVIFNITGETCFCTYSGIEKEAAVFYKTDQSNILWFPNSFLLMFVVASYPSAWLISYNFKYAYYVATFFNALGGWIRYAAFKNMPIAIIGEILIGVGQNFGFPSLIFIPERWFSKKEKFTALCIGSQSIFIGMGLGYILSPLIIGNDPEKIPLLNLIVSIALTVPLIICILVIKEKPDEAPNPAAEYQESLPKISLLTFYKNIWVLFSNLRFFMFLLIFGLCLASSYSFLSAIDYFLNSTEYTPVKVGIIGLIYVSGGSVADLAFSILIYKHRDKKHTLFNYCLKGLQVVLIISLTFFCIFIEKMDFKTMGIVAAILGIGFQGMVPFALEILEEVGQMDASLIGNSYAFFASLLSVTESQLMDLRQFKFYGIYCPLIILYYNDKLVFLLFQLPAIIVLMFFYNQIKQKREMSTAITIEEIKNEEN